MIVRRDLIARLAGRQPAIDFNAFDMLTGAALSSHLAQLFLLNSDTQLFRIVVLPGPVPICLVFDDLIRNLNGIETIGLHCKYGPMVTKV